MSLELKGAPVAKSIITSIKRRTGNLLTKLETKPKLAILRVGCRRDDLTYETALVKQCERVGITVEKIVLDQNATEETILNAIQMINQDVSIHACLMFRPLKDRRIEKKASKLLAPEKDIDGMTPLSQSGIFLGEPIGFPPCTARACLEILHYYGIELDGKNVTIIGRSLVIGKPVSFLLLNENATITICHSHSKNLPSLCQKSDVLIVAVGKKGLVDKSYVRPGQTVIDVGIHLTENGNMAGDVQYEAVAPIVAAITPVPGGVGSVTTAVLALQVVEACERISVNLSNAMVSED